ncbi:hypothetical protein [Companilactobacillus mishanensis]|uniref:DUF1430 domain-containing protein n=1 Tax=Companilactobacillus mishanensis TaxID=2486008 RepID=A0ABW9P869_9LACO|nr:hypothetical protein [Companilactobacillus mishanensis]MQS45142.1 hypothetical protein [Companilactobacillus mishanensis]
MNIRKIINLSIKISIVIQAVLCLLLAIFFLSDKLQTNVINYGSTEKSSVTVHINKIKRNNNEKAANFLLSQPAAIVKENLEVSQNKNPTIRVSIGGDKNKFSALSIDNITYIQKNDLVRLSENSNPKAIIGENTGSVNSIKRLPHILFSPNIYVDKLENNINDNILGNYNIVGLNYQQQKNFFKRLSKITGESVSDLHEEKSGFSIDNGTTGIILLSLIILDLLILVILLTIYVISSLKELGILSLLGWGKLELAYGLLGEFFNFSIFTMLISIALGISISGIYLHGIYYYLLSGFLNIFLTICILLVSIIMIIGVDVLNAIKGKLPKKVLYIFAVSLYLVLSIGLVFVSVALDKPIDTVKQNGTMLSNWSKVSEYETLKSVEAGNNQGTISGQDDVLDTEMWNWYKSIEEKKGVYLASGQFYSSSVLNNIRESEGRETPVTPFTLLKFSPNYLNDHNLQITKTDENLAYSGIRLYLIPSQWSKNEKETFKSWVRNLDLNNTDVNTTFGQDKKIKFVYYQSQQPIFTWLTDKGEPNIDRSPVILVSTANNMGLLEYGNLRANVLTGPLKFKNKIALNRNMKSNILKKFDLIDNKLEFVPVQKYVSGLQRELGTVIALFSGLTVFIIFTIVLILLTISLIFSISNSESLFVKGILGFSTYQLYWPLIISVGIIGLVKFFAVITFRSNLGLILIPIELLMEFMAIFIFAKNRGIKK